MLLRRPLVTDRIITFTPDCTGGPPRQAHAFPPKATSLRQESRDIIIESLRSDAQHSPRSAPERFPSDHLLDLELLHHYTTVLCVRASEDAQLRDIWQQDVIREALQHEFLLHGNLSLAAVHIISTSGDFNHVPIHLRQMSIIMTACSLTMPTDFLCAKTSRSVVFPAFETPIKAVKIPDLIHPLTWSSR